MIHKFEEFNESFFGLDKIKSAAKEYVESGAFSKDVKGNVSKKQLIKTFMEVESAKNKFGGVENLIKKVRSKLESKNESIVGVTTLSILGLHFFIKTLIAIKRGYNFKKYLVKLLAAEADGLRIPRDLILTIIFFFFVIFYSVGSNVWMEDTYCIDPSERSEVYTKWSFSWNGINDYKIKDSYGKIYDLKYIKLGLYDIYYQGKKIGIYKDNRLYKLDMSSCIYDGSPGKHDYGYKYIDYSLEKFLTSKTIHNEDEIKKNQDAIERNKKTIDSLTDDIALRRQNMTKENVSLSKKLLSEYGFDYDIITRKEFDYQNDDDMMDFYKERIKKFEFLPLPSIVKYFLEFRDELVKNSNIGYLGLFTKLFFNRLIGIEDAIRSKTISLDKRVNQDSIIESVCKRIKSIYAKIVEYKDILSNIRDSNGNIKDIMTFETIESLEDSLSRLNSWRIVNNFVKQFPAKQKSLIWKNGYFIDELKSKSQFLIQIIEIINKDSSMKSTFLSKISSLKTTNQLIDNLTRVSGETPWNFDYWMNLLNSKKDVIITWSSAEDNQIICAVFGYDKLKEIAYMTNWCIVRHKSNYDYYTEEGKIQYVLYDFNLPQENNDCVMGITLEDNFGIYACHNKVDFTRTPPIKFLASTAGRKKYMNPKFVKFSTSQMIKKLNSGITKILLTKFKSFLSKGKISSFLNWYEGDGY